MTGHYREFNLSLTRICFEGVLTFEVLGDKKQLGRSGPNDISVERHPGAISRRRRISIRGGRHFFWPLILEMAGL